MVTVIFVQPSRCFSWSFYNYYHHVEFYMQHAICSNSRSGQGIVARWNWNGLPWARCDRLAWITYNSNNWAFAICSREDEKLNGAVEIPVDHGAHQLALNDLYRRLWHTYWIWDMFVHKHTSVATLQWCSYYQNTIMIILILLLIRSNRRWWYWKYLYFWYRLRII